MTSVRKWPKTISYLRIYPDIDDAAIEPPDLSLVDSSYYVGLEPERALELLKREEARLHKQVVALRTLQNRYVPIYRLPDELLAKILSLVHQSSERRICEYPSPILASSWIHLTHICRRLREVVLQNAVFWTSVDASDVNRARTFLRRSKGADVSMYLDGYRLRYHVEEFVSLLKQNIHRTVALYVTLDGETLSSFLKLVDFSLHPVRQLELSRIGTSRTDWDTVIIPKFDPVYTEQPWALEKLKLENVTMPWDTFAFHQLRSLHLLFPWHVGFHMPSVDRVLDILTTCPLLEHLYLQHAAPKSESAAIPHSIPSRTIELTQLRELILVFGDPDDVSRLLAHLVIPDTTEMTLCVNSFLDRHISGLLDALPLDRSGLRCIPTIRHVTMSNDPGYDTPYTAGIAVHGHQTKGGKAIMKISTCVEVSPEEELTGIHCAGILNSLGPVFAVAPIESLSVISEPLITSVHDWRATLSKFPQLRILNIGTALKDIEESDFAPFIALRPGDDLICPCPCPNLSELKVDGALIDKDYLHSLVECLKARAEHGIPALKKLVIVDITWADDWDPDVSTIGSYVEDYELSTLA